MMDPTGDRGRTRGSAHRPGKVTLPDARPEDAGIVCPPCVPRDCPPRLCPEDAPRAARPAAHAVTWPGLDRGRWEDAERENRRLPRPGSLKTRPLCSTLVLPLSNQIKPLLRGNEGKPREADWDGLDRKTRKNTSKTAVFKGWWWGMDSNHRTHRGQIYSLLRLATSLPHHMGHPGDSSLVERKGFEPSTPTLRT